MNIIVKKFGGTVSSASKIKNIAKIVEESSQNRIYRLVCDGQTTDQLVSLAQKCSKNPDPKDYDLLVSSGEQVSISLYLWL